MKKLSTVETYLDDAANAQDRTVKPDPCPQNGLMFPFCLSPTRRPRVNVHELRRHRPRLHCP